MPATRAGERGRRAADEGRKTRPEERGGSSGAADTPGQPSTSGTLGARLVTGGSGGRRRALGDSTGLCSKEDRNWVAMEAGNGIKRDLFWKMREGLFADRGDLANPSESAERGRGFPVTSG